MITAWRIMESHKSKSEKCKRFRKDTQQSLKAFGFSGCWKLSKARLLLWIVWLSPDIDRILARRPAHNCLAQFFIATWHVPRPNCLKAIGQNLCFWQTSASDWLLRSMGWLSSKPLSLYNKIQLNRFNKCCCILNPNIPGTLELQCCRMTPTSIFWKEGEWSNDTAKPKRSRSGCLKSESKHLENTRRKQYTKRILHSFIESQRIW